MNKVIIMGRLTKDPDIRYSRQGDRDLAIVRFTLAVDRPKRRDQQNTADFISCVGFDRQAEFADKYLRKGTKLAIVGRIQTGSYTDQSGTRRYTTDVVIENMEFAESKAQNDGSNPNYVDSFNTQPAPSGDADEGFMSIPEGVEDAGLPFN